MKTAYFYVLRSPPEVGFMGLSVYREGPVRILTGDGIRGG